MSFSKSSTPPAQQSPALADRRAFVREMLSGRSKSPASDHERRILKILERLHPAANVALAGAAIASAGSPDQSFQLVLAQLSNA